jgi:hypothetical protein
VHHDHGEIGDAESGERFADKIEVSRRIEDVEFLSLQIWRWRSLTW